MRLNLGEIINIPGGVVPFEYELDVSDLHFPSVKEFSAPVLVSGQVMNRAGVLIVTGKLQASMTCICARCLKEFTKHLDLDLNAFLAEEIQNEENEDSEDIYLLQGDYVDVDEIAVTTLVPNMEQQIGRAHV